MKLSIKEAIPAEGFLEKRFSQLKLVAATVGWGHNSTLPLLSPEGLCNGLCIDYARHLITSRNIDTPSDYVVKLQRKLKEINDPVDSKYSLNFLKRVQDYQEYVHPWVFISAKKRGVIKEIQPDDLKEIFSSTSMIYLKLMDRSKGVEDDDISNGIMFGDEFYHSIVLSLLKDQDHKIIKYVIFDSNFGEYKSDNLDECAQIIHELGSRYKCNRYEALDLENFITHNEFVKDVGMASAKEGKHLYTGYNDDELLSIKLHAICKDGDAMAIHRVLANAKTEVNKVDVNGVTPLYKACFNGHTAIVKLMLANPRVEINKADKNGITPFYAACFKGHIGIVKMMLSDPRVEVNKADENGITPFYGACDNECIRSVKIMLADPRVEVNKADTSGVTPFYGACFNGRTEVVKTMIVDPRVEISKPDLEGLTPFEAACLKGQSEIIRIMLSNSRVYEDHKSFINGIRILEEEGYNFRKGEDFKFRDINIEDSWSDYEVIQDFLNQPSKSNKGLNNFEAIVNSSDIEDVKVVLKFKNTISMNEERLIRNKYGDQSNELLVNHRPYQSWYPGKHLMTFVDRIRGSKESTRDR